MLRDESSGSSSDVTALPRPSPSIEVWLHSSPVQKVLAGVVAFGKTEVSHLWRFWAFPPLLLLRGHRYEWRYLEVLLAKSSKCRARDNEILSHDLMVFKGGRLVQISVFRINMRQLYQFNMPHVGALPIDYELSAG